MKSTTQRTMIQVQRKGRDWKYEYGSPEANRWNYRNNPAVRELLDHLADELAVEYSKLMDESKVRMGSVK